MRVVLPGLAPRSCRRWRGFFLVPERGARLIQDYKGTSLLSVSVTHLDRAVVGVQLSCTSHALACLEAHVQTCLYTVFLASCSYYQGGISSVTLKAGSVKRLISSGVYPISSLIGWPPSSRYLHPAQSNALSSRAVLPVWREEELHFGEQGVRDGCCATIR